MSVELTFSMIKPDAVNRAISGAINSIIESSGFKIVAQKLIKITLELAKKFYEIHKDKPFYEDLCKMISSGPVVVQVLKKENAVIDYRKLMGATNPEQADVGTIRNKYGLSIDQNSIHGSDSLENAKKEIDFFFSNIELVNL